MSGEDKARRGFPASIAVLLISAGVFALSVFPFTGIFLMFIAAPLWSILLVNLGCLLTFYDVLGRGLSKLLLVIPVLYFGGYGAVTILSHAIGSGIVITSETGSNLPSLRADQALTLESIPDFDDLKFLADYNVGAIYWKGQHNSFVVDGPCQPYSLGLNVPGSKCALDGLSAWKLHPDIPPSAMTVRAEWHKVKDVGPLFFKKFDFDYVISEGALSRHATGYLKVPLTWVPLPIAGCFLVDNPSAWLCKAQFTFEDDLPFVSNLWNSVLARATGITKRT